MRFRPDPEDVVMKNRGSEFKPLSAGEYQFEIAECIECTSKSGNNQFKLMLIIYDEGEAAARVFDYLVFTEKMKWKFRHAMYATGMKAEYESGKVEAMDFVGKAGRVLLKVKPAQGEYSARNEVEDYIVPEENENIAPPHSDFDQPLPSQDDLPF